MENIDKDWDVFISYASEDRKDVAGPLAQQLRSEGLNVWFDQFELKLGDSLSARIDDGLVRCKYGVVILSEDFFKKDFPLRELQGLLQREVAGQKVVLPVWHQVTAKRVRELYPSLGDRVYVETKDGLEEVAARILAVVRCRCQTLSQIEAIQFKAVTSEHLRVLEDFVGPDSLRDIMGKW
jgi:TIR domain